MDPMPQSTHSSIRRRERILKKVEIEMAASMAKPLLVLFLCASLHGLRAAGAARLPPGASPLVSACTAAPYPELCVRELGQRLLDIQTALAAASSSGQGATIAGAPGQVDTKALVAVAMQAAAEAGTIASSVFEGKLPGFNGSVPDAKKCFSNCSVTMKSAMKKLHGASAAIKAGANDLGKMLALRALTDVSSCALSCKELHGDVHLILQQSLVEFQKMLQIAMAFIGKMKSKPGPPGPEGPPGPAPPEPFMP
ncbi:hypothetical protein ACP4OV_007848 [Aristida adscensionis]